MAPMPTSDIVEANPNPEADPVKGSTDVREGNGPKSDSLDEGPAPGRRTEAAAAEAASAVPSAAAAVGEKNDGRAGDGEGDGDGKSGPGRRRTEFPYITGIPTLRSSAHRVRWSTKKNRSRRKDRPRGATGATTVAATSENGGGGGGSGEEGEFSSRLPPSLREEHVFAYDADGYDLRGAIAGLLGRSDSGLLGGWPDGGGDCDGDAASADGRRRLEDFRVPPRSLSRRDFGGQCEDAQKYLSDRMANDEVFLEAFDRLVVEVVVPELKSRLVDCGLVAEGDGPTAFFYQRPPTLRLQPGPSRSTVKPHRDSEYGHQDGELNFWIPLVDCARSGCYLWTESEPDRGDYHPLVVRCGEMAAFHGSYCRHYVPANPTVHTRASLDFRVGIGGLFDPEWMMLGTKDDHSRWRVEV